MGGTARFGGDDDLPRVEDVVRGPGHPPGGPPPGSPAPAGSPPGGDPPSTPGRGVGHPRHLPRTRRRRLAGWAVAGGLAGLLALSFGGERLVMTTSRHDATVAAGVERIEIRTGDRDLTVRPQANANAVRVAMRGPRSECTARSWREDATLVVDTSCTAPLSRAAEVTIPPGSNVDVVAASGDVEMGGGWYNTVRVTSQDDVDLDGVGGNVAVTTSGDVRGRSAGADVAVTAGGDVRLDLSDPSSALRSADVRTTDGDVDLELPRAPSYRIDVQTSGENDVDVQDDPKAQGVVRVRSQSGDVDIEH